MAKTAEVAVYRIGKPPVMEKVALTLDAQVALIGGGWLKECELDHLFVFYDGEARENGKLPNRQVGRIHVLGDFFVCRVKDGETVSLTEVDRAYLKKNYSL